MVILFGENQLHQNKYKITMRHNTDDCFPFSILSGNEHNWWHIVDNRRPNEQLKNEYKWNKKKIFVYTYVFEAVFAQLW